MAVQTVDSVDVPVAVAIDPGVADNNGTTPNNNIIAQPYYYVETAYANPMGEGGGNQPQIFSVSREENVFPRRKPQSFFCYKLWCPLCTITFVAFLIILFTVPSIEQTNVDNIDDPSDSKYSTSTENVEFTVGETFYEISCQSNTCMSDCGNLDQIENYYPSQICRYFQDNDPEYSCLDECYLYYHFSEWKEYLFVWITGNTNFETYPEGSDCDGTDLGSSEWEDLDFDNIVPFVRKLCNLNSGRCGHLFDTNAPHNDFQNTCNDCFEDMVDVFRMFYGYNTEFDSDTCSAKFSLLPTDDVSCAMQYYCDEPALWN
mmetsp:Transcript_7482/g.9729  ORF Transcript_7482/g.9729 Transcript_7482/m.9729 type:complete len:316 (+) Transcript_7482:18-965(+)|eukprot:CAMPEP_0117777268 /NCGR_PEP_ID=MMETSP0948-20121206/285_1 /TAXON_ID=44440 /ORGANISM="Chattonella subsalsa, Strain CCMP2191" /LENGTH=315 /DNA_ID=CAMNT_0005604347 /DNA_START=185 /DNA_END=1132 /DNA_ORIENTATION=-